MTIEQELSEITNKFTDKSPALRCWTMEEKQEAVRVLSKYYNNVEVSDGRHEGESKMSWVIACSNRKIQESFLTEDEDNPEDFNDSSDIVGDDDLSGFDFSEFDDVEDDMDLDDENLDTIDDMGEVDKAEKITVLKKQADDFAKKYLDVYKQISNLARGLDLIISKDDDLKISLKKSNGKESKYKDDLDTIKLDAKKAMEGDVDDSYGPSEYGNEPSSVENNPAPPYEESLALPQNITLAESNFSDNHTSKMLSVSDPNEIQIREDEVDDDF